MGMCIHLWRIQKIFWWNVPAVLPAVFNWRWGMLLLTGGPAEGGTAGHVCNRQLNRMSKLACCWCILSIKSVLKKSSESPKVRAPYPRDALWLPLWSSEHCCLCAGCLYTGTYWPLIFVQQIQHDKACFPTRFPVLCIAAALNGSCTSDSSPRALLPKPLGEHRWSSLKENCALLGPCAWRFTQVRSPALQLPTRVARQCANHSGFSLAPCFCIRQLPTASTSLFPMQTVNEGLPSVFPQTHAWQYFLNCLVCVCAGSFPLFLL